LTNAISIIIIVVVAIVVVVVVIMIIIVVIVVVGVFIIIIIIIIEPSYQHTHIPQTFYSQNTKIHSLNHKTYICFRNNTCQVSLAKILGMVCIVNFSVNTICYSGI
jgi:hypothetical protein